MTGNDPSPNNSHHNNNKSSVAFSIDESQASATATPRKKRPSLAKRMSKRSSFFTLRSLSFRRSDGNRGADIDTLRGTNGPDFEGYATIKRADGFGVCCTCFGNSSDDHKEKILLIKGPYLFVFVKETDTAPKYAIELAHMKTKMQQQSSEKQQNMTIETSLGDVEWELTFEQKNIAKQFSDAFKQQAAIGEAEEVRERLGHKDLLSKRASVKYAEKVGGKKCEDQPEKKENAGLEEYNREAVAMTGGPGY
ncbi:MAG: hypothetical protein SGILL_004428 [Bacillariaceae sp.]